MYKFFAFLLILTPALAVSQNGPLRGSVPEVLLRPARGESPRFPVDLVIGELGQGSATSSAYSYANTIGTGLLSGQAGHPSLSSINPVIRENYLSAVRAVNPASFRIGGGRTEADGAVSFLIRFIGRDRGITGELYIRYVTRQLEDDGETRTIGSWVFEDLLFDEAKERETENSETVHFNNFYPYERFF